MSVIFKLLMALLREFVFTNADEYKLSSHKFDLKKAFVAILIVCLFATTITFMIKSVKLSKIVVEQGNQLRTYKEKADSKNPPPASSDSGNGLTPSENWPFVDKTQGFLPCDPAVCGY